MRKSEREIKNFNEIVDLVNKCQTIRLGINDEKAPYVVPLSFGYEVKEGKIIIYIHGAKVSKKFELISKNPNVCVEGDICNKFIQRDHGRFTCDYESFIGYGQAVKVPHDECEKAVELILEHCGFKGCEYNRKIVEFTGIYKIKLDSITGRRRFL